MRGLYFIWKWRKIVTFEDGFFKAFYPWNTKTFTWKNSCNQDEEEWQHNDKDEDSDKNDSQC